MSQSKEREGPDLKSATILSSLCGLIVETQLLNEEDFFRLADELEKNPPPDLTPSALSLVIQILRGEEPHLDDEPSSNKVY